MQRASFTDDTPNNSSTLLSFSGEGGARLAAVLSLIALALVMTSAMLACQSGGSDAGDASVQEPGSDAGTGGQPDAQPEPQSTCSEDFLGAGDGCDCGCGVVDPDCPTPTQVSDCQFNNCAADFQINPAQPSLCQPIPVPQGWTCSPSLYGGDAACSCGCGVLDDKDCSTPLTVAACAASQNGCSAGSSPNPANPTACVTSPAGWTCNWKSYYDDVCDCGCGIADPACPANTHVSDCQVDGCGTGLSPDPAHLSACIAHAPQDSWTCDLAKLLDGQNCDCGCGAVDPDCGTATSPAACDTVNCPLGDELQPDSLAECWESCTPMAEPVGNASCTNGGVVSIFSSCNRHLSACTDGRSYEVECNGSECVCRVNGNCVAHEVGTCSLNFTCGWSLVDNT